MIEPFIPAADEVRKLAAGKDAVSRTFQSQISTRHVKGHQTSQGTYIVTPSGKLLATAHTIEKDDIEAFLKDGLEKYAALSQKERLGKKKRGGSQTTGYPEDGLVLKVHLRKFYDTVPSRRGIVQYNRDFAWYKAVEMKKFVPASPKVDDKYVVPKSLVMRLARFHFTDTVRAFADPYSAKCVREARLTATVESVDDGKVRLRYAGKIHSEQKDTPKRGLSVEPGLLPRRAYRQFNADLLGFATFDQQENKFESFELTALGIQQGGGTRGVEDVVTIGVALTIAEDTPTERVPPHQFELYR